MLIRHIAIHRQSIPISLQSHKNIQITYEDRDYSDYLTRTLNPQLTDKDVLIPINAAHCQQVQQLKNSSKTIFERSESMLERQTPQSYQNFTNFNLDQQDQLNEGIQLNQREKRSNGRFYRKQNGKNKVNRISQLNNQSYLQNKRNKRDYSPTPLLSKTNSLKNQRLQQENDCRLVNNHARSSIVHGDLYRTLQKIQSKILNNHFPDSNRPLINKKYSYSLPKTSFIPKSISKITQFTQTQRQDFIESKPIPKRVHKQKEFKFLIEKNQTNYRKKLFLPNEEQNDQRQEINFVANNKNQKRVKEQQKQTNKAIKLEKQFNQSGRNVKISPAISLEFLKQNIQISYRTSLSQLKQICALRQVRKVNLIMKIPEIFSYPLFTGLQDQINLFSKSEQLLKHLQIKNKNDLSIKKYYNCILLIVNYIAVVWHYTGKRYLGGWKYEMLDDGHKHGLGLEWSPKQYVYYGQFSKGKRQGVGIMKNSNDELLVGLWHSNRYIKSLSSNQMKQKENDRLL